MIINLNKKFKSLKGEEIEGATLGQILAGKLAETNEGDAIKYYDWALKLHNNEEINIDNSDYRKLYDFVKDSKALTNLAKAQVLKGLESQKEE